MADRLYQQTVAKEDYAERLQSFVQRLPAALRLQGCRPKGPVYLYGTCMGAKVMIEEPFSGPSIYTYIYVYMCKFKYHIRTWTLCVPWHRARSLLEESQEGLRDGEV